MFPNQLINTLPFTLLFIPKKKRLIQFQNLFTFSLQTRSLCTLAVRNLDAYRLDTHKVKKNGMLGKGEDTHERAAHISLAPSSLRPASQLGSQSATRQAARVVGNKHS